MFPHVHDDAPRISDNRWDHGLAIAAIPGWTGDGHGRYTHQNGWTAERTTYGTFAPDVWTFTRNNETRTLTDGVGAPRRVTVERDGTVLTILPDAMPGGLHAEVRAGTTVIELRNGSVVWSDTRYRVCGGVRLNTHSVLTPLHGAHRVDGPAVETGDAYTAWWVCGVRVTEHTARTLGEHPAALRIFAELAGNVTSPTGRIADTQRLAEAAVQLADG